MDESAAKPPIWFDDSEWVEGDIPKRPWIAQGYLLRGAVTVVSGAAGVSKSSLTVAFAASLALGIPFHKLQPGKPARVLVYNTEDDETEQRRRFSAALRQMGATPRDISGKVARVGPNQVGTLLVRDPEFNSIGFTPALDHLVELIRSFRPDVVILDPLVELHDCDENDNTALRLVMATLRSIAIDADLALVLLHHTRKGAATPGDPDSSRGASAIVGAARVVLTVTSMSEDEAKAFGLASDVRRHYFRLDSAKSNYAAIGDAEWFERVTYQLDNGDHVAAPVPWCPPVDVVSPEARVKIEAGIAAGSLVGPWSSKLSNDARSVKSLMTSFGIATQAGQRRLLSELLAAGFTVASYRRADNRVKAQGLRSPAGKPTNVVWAVEEADEADGSGTQ